MSDLLDGRVIIITGASRGIGQTYCIGMADQGAKIVAADILDSSETVDAINAKHPGSAIAVTVDITDFASCEAMVVDTLKAFGRLDGLVNNAAMFGAVTGNSGLDLGTFDSISEDAWDNMMKVNIKGTWNCIRAVSPTMVEAGYGKILNVSSNTISLGAMNLLHYVTSKGAVATMTRCLSRELGPQGVRVNCLSPGFIQTQASIDMMDKHDAHGITEAMKDICSLGRVQYADDLLGTVVYLSSELSDFVTGQILNVDGGACFTGM